MRKAGDTTEINLFDCRFGHEIAGADGQTGSFFPLANEQRADRRANRKQHQALSPVSTDFDPKEVRTVAIHLFTLINYHNEM